MFQLTRAEFDNRKMTDGERFSLGAAGVRGN